MTIRQRSLSTILVTTIVLVVVLYVVSRVIILDGFSKVEASMMERDVARVVSILQHEMSSLGHAARQWTTLDDAGTTSDAGGVDDSRLENLGLDAVLILDSSGKTAAGSRVGGRRKVDHTTLEQIRRIFFANPSLTGAKDPSRVLTGILALKNGPFMFASRPIVRGTNAQTVPGTLILGRYVDDASARRVSNMVRMKILFRSPRDARSAGVSGSSDPTRADPISVHAHDDTLISGFGMILDPFGQPALIVAVQSGRGLYQVGRATANYFLFCLAVVGIIFGAVSWETLEKGILVPLMRLIRDVAGIAERGSSSDRVTSQGNDEMSRLADAINSMLDALERSEHALTEARIVLERKVRERTAQLTEINERLTEEVEIRKRAQEELRAGEERYRAVVDNQTELICRFSPDYRLTFVNDAYCRYFDAGSEDLIGTIVPQAAERNRDGDPPHSVPLPTKENPLITYERRVVLDTGEARWQQWSDRAICDDKGEIVEFQSVGRDITQLKAAAREKEHLLQEVHHRVKNNLQIMMSLLGLQTEYVEDPRSLELFEDAERRILTMALVHEHLYQSESLSEVKAQEYLLDLVDELLCTYDDAGRCTNVEVHAGDVSFGVETAVPLGLIVSELVSNTIKHAFSHTEEGEIQVSLQPIGDNRFELRFADNGVGFSAHGDWNRHESFGLFLVRSLVEQLHGEVAVDTSRGAAFLIRFQAVRPKRSGWSNE
ncbi:MAG: histidine kinase dimerization/phosphoacceptor domain -containing protein [Desulfomonilaceae bacterium]|nr:histidine kinase dimerization/phosphoacceptor domain -containing protein [Desulfomonilaceae bacterium]